MEQSNSKKKFAIYGGSFDPIHVGHVALADAAVREIGLDKLIFMPAFISPFKMKATASAGKVRCDMIKAVLPLNDAFCLSEYELNKGGEASYTIETLRYFDSLTDDILYFVLGFDSILFLDKWYKGEEILRDYPLITARRPDTDDSEGMRVIDGFRKKYGAEIHVLDMAPVDAASSEIREIVKNGGSITGLVTKEVEKYIAENKLYRDSQ
jgi:nicotinate-nucleotide adenylyltransferase